MRKEFPRPDFERKEWLSLNGTWDFAFDDDNPQKAKEYVLGEGLDKTIEVPFCYQSKLSGIGDEEYHPVVWYAREVFFTQEQLEKCVLLKFGAVDYSCDLYVNGTHVREHTGGHVQFSTDITGYVHPGTNKVVLRVEDDLRCDKPRGKQYWDQGTWGCWYTPTTGIWLSAWIEFVGNIYLDNLRLTPDIDDRCLSVETVLNRFEPGQLVEISVDVFYEGVLKKRVIYTADDLFCGVKIPLMEENKVDEIQYWSPWRPSLYDVLFTVRVNNYETDRVRSYFGMRKIEARGDVLLLNNKPVKLKMVLDQGYWQDSLMTPPSDEDIRLDIEMTKKFGFNGARKHQKFEDPRYYYWADKLGLFVWAEMPSSYQFNTRQIELMTDEWSHFLQQSYNHPSIIAWVPFNESWGIRNVVSDQRQQNYVRGIYYLTKAYDATRLVSSNDGWEMLNETDLIGIHDYVPTPDIYHSRYDDFQTYCHTGIDNRLGFAYGNEYRGQPILMTEYGGIAFESENNQAWGYFGNVKTEEEFLIRLGNIQKAIADTPYLCGFCYTQLTDVQQEINGLMTMDRQPKVDPEKIRQLIE